MPGLPRDGSIVIAAGRIARGAGGCAHAQATVRQLGHFCTGDRWVGRARAVCRLRSSRTYGKPNRTGTGLWSAFRSAYSAIRTITGHRCQNASTRISTQQGGRVHFAWPPSPCAPRLHTSRRSEQNLVPCGAGTGPPVRRCGQAAFSSAGWNFQSRCETGRQLRQEIWRWDAAR
jgi:hypothetical protein